LAEFNHLNGI